MKKVLPLLLVLALCFAFFACGKKDTGTKDDKKDTPASADAATEAPTEAVTNNPDLEAVLETDDFRDKIAIYQDESRGTNVVIEGDVVVLVMQYKIDLSEEELAEINADFENEEGLASVKSIIANLGFADAGVENVQYKIRVLDKDGNLLGEAAID